MKLSNLFTDGMVLQRGEKTTIFGTAAPSEPITVQFLSESYTTTTDTSGNWSILFSRLAPGGPFELTITGTEEKKVIHDVYIGDVWLLGGQSNMQLPVSRVRVRFEEEAGSADEPAIRSFEVPMQYRFGEQIDTLEQGHWEGLSRETVNRFSAAGFFMARKLYAKYGVPIGLLQSAIGGVTAESFISEETLISLGGYEEDLNKHRDSAYIKSIQDSEQASMNEWYRTLDEADEGLKNGWQAAAATDWSETFLPSEHAKGEWKGWHGSVWVKKEFTLAPEDISDGMLVLGTLIDADQTYVNGTLVGRTEYCYPPRRYPVAAGLLKPGTNNITVRVISTGSPWTFILDKQYQLCLKNRAVELSGTWKYRVGATKERRLDETFFQYKPGSLYNGMLYPLRKFAIAAAAFYQGESNTSVPDTYERVFRAMLHDWRALFQRSDLPVVFIQLPNFSDAIMETTKTDWAELREAQRKALCEPNTAMVTAIDCGEYNDLHPLDKKTVGERIAACAGALVYGDTSVSGGPMAEYISREADCIRIHFSSAGSGLVKKVTGLPISWFEVQNTDGTWNKATAFIEGDTLCLAAESPADVKAVRYAWNNNPYGINLYNREGFPAVPFRMELV